MLYADPGSGILIWQMLLALFIGATFYFSKFRTWVTTKFKHARHAEISKPLPETSAQTSLPRVK
jgi:hypothetical protein